MFENFGFFVGNFGMSMMTMQNVSNVILQAFVLFSLCNSRVLYMCVCVSFESLKIKNIQTEEIDIQFKICTYGEITLRLYTKNYIELIIQFLGKFENEILESISFFFW
jgi:hypothetical protein